ncbi:hypothetical protein ACFWJW_29970, partial [Streptomyces sp. NPDC127097]|uniref:hypothetical protein n=1 Tax=Streptomyces sp. NPDC127097 TaxID=3347136 RepID=UPI0036609AE3
ILAGPIFAGAFPPFGFFAFPTLPDPFPSLAPCWSGLGRLAFAFRPFRLYQIRFGPLPVRIGFRFPVGGGSPFGFSDFIRRHSVELIGRSFR